MSKGNAWMPLYVGDYMRDTGHLDATEHGAYLLLIMHYWNTGPVKDDDRALANITRSGASWPMIADTIKSFFTLDNGVLRHKRIDAEREKVDAISGKRRAAGIAGASVRYSKPIANAMANGMANAEQTEWQTHRQSHSQSQSYPQSNPELNNDIYITSNALPVPVAALPEVLKRGRGPAKQDDPDFAEFWLQYPRKVGKGSARAAWAAAIRKADAAEILAGLSRVQWPADVQYIPHPTTWLRQERWGDEEPDNSLEARMGRATSAIDWSTFDD